MIAFLTRAESSSVTHRLTHDDNSGHNSNAERWKDTEGKRARGSESFSRLSGLWLSISLAAPLSSPPPPPGLQPDGLLSNTVGDGLDCSLLQTNRTGNTWKLLESLTETRQSCLCDLTSALRWAKPLNDGIWMLVMQLAPHQTQGDGHTRTHVCTNARTCTHSKSKAAHSSPQPPAVAMESCHIALPRR